MVSLSNHHLCTHHVSPQQHGLCAPFDGLRTIGQSKGPWLVQY